MNSTPSETPTKDRYIPSMMRRVRRVNIIPTSERSGQRRRPRAAAWCRGSRAASFRPPAVDGHAGHVVRGQAVPQGPGAVERLTAVTGAFDGHGSGVIGGPEVGRDRPIPDKVSGNRQTAASVAFGARHVAPSLLLSWIERAVAGARTLLPASHGWDSSIPTSARLPTRR